MNWSDIRKNWRDWVGLLCRAVVGLVLLIAGLIKCFNLEQSVQATRAYKMLPFDIATIAGYGLPVIEVILGLLLLVGLLTRASALASGLLMLAFIYAIAQAWYRGIALDCGCFGGGGEVERIDPWVYTWEIVRDAAVALCAAWLVWRPKTPYSLDEKLFGTPDFSDEDFDDDVVDVTEVTPAKESHP